MLAVGARAQTPALPPTFDSVLVVPGPDYMAGPLYRAFMGSGYRDLWTTAIRVPVADLSTLGGGLTPVRVGGGMTTQTLHLDGADGRRYVFRSVDKEPIDLIDDFVGTPIEAILRDQISAFHPSGAVVVAGLLDAVGVLHPDPRIMVIPDDPRLGEFGQEFAGMLVLFEERPDDGPEGGPGFAGSRQIVQTDRLLTLLEGSPRHRVATDELLRARLVDLLVGDRDRSTNNHLWARFEDSTGGYIWRPIPRDRDQAFVQLDGVLKGLGRLYEPRLVHFRDRYPSVAGLSRNAWDIDRNLLVGVSRDEWLETVAEVQRLISDEVIGRAVRRLPTGHYEIVGEELAATLRRRRDRLDRAAEDLYAIVFGYADVHGTDAAESASVVRSGDGSVSVTVQPDTQTVGPSFDRTFSPVHTREVRLYMHGGADVVTITGSGPGSIRLRVIGGEGRDRLIDRSSSGSGANVFYDAGDATEVMETSSTRVERRSAPRPFSWFEERRTLDWGSSWIPEPRFGYDGDRGLVLTAGLTYDRYGFLKSPYASRMRLSAGWAFGLDEPLLDYRQHLRGALGAWDLQLHARWSGMELIDFYGLGNETSALGPASFHRVAHKQVVLSALASFGDGERRSVSLGPVFQYLSTDTTGASSFVGDTRPYGSGGFGQVGVQAALELDARDRAGTPSHGYLLQAGASFYPELASVKRGVFGAAEGQAAAYLSPPGANPTLALRMRGRRLWGTYPFAEAAFLGGPTSLRGLREQRLAGDASLLGSAELRVDVARLLFIVPADVGILGLTDAGRVFREGENSSHWYTSLGGGIWVAPLRRSSTVQLTVARAESRTALYVGIGFAY